MPAYSVLVLDALVPNVTLAEFLQGQGQAELAMALRKRQKYEDALVPCVIMHHMAMLLLFTLLVAARASGCITEERERRSWEGLLLTSLSTHDIIHGKQRGVIRACVPYLIAHALLMVVLTSWLGGQVICASLIVCVGTFITINWVVAVGIWCSACLHSSWRSLLITLVACGIASQMILSIVGLLSAPVLVAVVRWANDWPLFRNPGPAMVLFAIAAILLLAIYGTTTWLVANACLFRAIDRINQTERGRRQRTSYYYLT